MLEKNEESYLATNNLSKSFGTFEAIRNISINIQEGEFVCFLGPSGCGKTTLLRCIAGLEIQSTGSVIQLTAIKSRFWYSFSILCAVSKLVCFFKYSLWISKQ